MPFEGRNDKIDIVKGIAIFFMIWGHCIQYCCLDEFDFFMNGIFKFIYSFHMPLLMLISGYLFYFSSTKRDFMDLVASKINGILYPLLVVGIINYFITKGVTDLVILGDWTDIQNGAWITGVTSLWFLWSVLAASLVMSIAVKIIKSFWVKIIVIVTGYFIMLGIPNDVLNAYMYPYFIIGYLGARFQVACKCKTFSKIQKLVLMIACMFVYMCMYACFDKHHYIYVSGIAGGWIDIFRWVIGLLGSVCVCYIVNGLYVRMRAVSIASVMFEGLKVIGRQSLQIYCMSVSLLSFYLPYIASIVFCGIDWNNSMLIYNVIVTPIVAIMYTLLLNKVNDCLYKMGVGKIMFGR